jgi:anion-transporting  ArsA/GET3 family ATPase
MKHPIQGLLRDRRLVVSCGAGGVGKTTVSAAMALAAARMGQRVLVVTIDPSKRLAETLGVSAELDAPVTLSADRLEALGIRPPGQLSAWMLDPKRVSDNVVRRFSKSEEDARSLLSNRIYANLSGMVAGMQEYTAVEALHGFVADDAYDLIVLDTPPSRNALRFLDAPDRVGGFLDRRIFNLFVPGDAGMIRRAANALITRVLDLALGKPTREELQSFLALFGALLAHLNRNQSQMRTFLKSDAVGFVLVTSPERAALDEVFAFEQRARETLHLPVAGFVLNATLANRARWPLPIVEDAPAALREAVTRLRRAAETEQTQARTHLALIDTLSARVRRGFVWALPRLGTDASDLAALIQLADALLGEPP